MQTIKPVILSLFFSCFAHASDDKDWDNVPELYVEDPTQLDCDPKKLESTDSLVLTLGPEHGYELAITRAADNQRFDLVYDGSATDNDSMLSPVQFEAATQLKIPLSQQAAYGDWAGERKRGLIFSLPGEYIIHSSRNFEAPNTIYVCKVMFKGLLDERPASRTQR